MHAYNNTLAILSAYHMQYSSACNVVPHYLATHSLYNENKLANYICIILSLSQLGELYVAIGYI